VNEWEWTKRRPEVRKRRCPHNAQEIPSLDNRSPIGEVAKKHGISDQTVYAWRKRFGKLEAADVKRLRQLEHENLKLKKLVAERDLEIEAMREVAAKKW
jgi:putative transposase